MGQYLSKKARFVIWLGLIASLVRVGIPMIVILSSRHSFMISEIIEVVSSIATIAGFALYVALFVITILFQNANERMNKNTETIYSVTLIYMVAYFGSLLLEFLVDFTIKGLIPILLPVTLFRCLLKEIKEKSYCADNKASDWILFAFNIIVMVANIGGEIAVLANFAG